LVSASASGWNVLPLWCSLFWARFFKAEWSVFKGF
jgi:hypothetical protein